MKTGNLNSILVGTGSGVLMALVVLTMIRRSMIPAGLLTLLVQCALACALPGCLEVLGSRVDLFRTEVIMVAVSMVIGILYALTVSMNRHAMDELLQAVVTIHVCSAVAVAVRQIVRRRGKAS
ncbi:MAG: hypothetical protein K6E41_03115 [Solobacterium sp.]|jgi:hypothetical protein|nr:hypothetical protein [Solobacterium sp.]